MKTSSGNRPPRALRGLPIPLVASVATPAFAHHPSGPGGTGSGASMIVVNPDTLPKGDLWIGSWLIYANPDQRTDEELAELAGHHIHSHDYD